MDVEAVFKRAGDGQEKFRSLLGLYVQLDFKDEKEDETLAAGRREKEVDGEKEACCVNDLNVERVGKEDGFEEWKRAGRCCLKKNTTDGNEGV